MQIFIVDTQTGEKSNPYTPNSIPKMFHAWTQTDAQQI
jgi:hypothetical protein